MKNLAVTLLVFLSLAISPNLFAQNVSINADGSLPDTSAMLDVSSTTKGLLLPRMTTTQQNAIILPANGLSIFNTTLNSIMLNTGTPLSPVWSPLNAGAIDTSSIANFYLKVRSVLSAGAGITYSNATGVISNSGVRSLNGLTGNVIFPLGNLSETGSSVLTITGGTNAVIGVGGVGLQVKQASGTQDGFLSGTDWTTFNNKGSGSVTNVTATAPLSITGTSTITPNVVADTSKSTGKLATFSDVALKQDQLNGTGFVKATGTTITYDNSTYLTSIDTTNIANFASKVRSLFSSTAPITYSNGLIGITQSGTSTNGYLSSTDWNTFNNKQSAGSYLTGNQTITLSGDVTGSGTTAITTNVGKINGTSLASLGTGILKNTTGTGVPSIAIASDFPTLNQNTTGSAATLTTGRTIAITGDLTYTSPAFNGSTNVTAAGTLATVNANTGSFTNANITVNGKGLITAASNGNSGTVTNIATGYGLSGGPITSTGTIIVDSATLHLKFLALKDSVNSITGYTTLYQNSLKQNQLNGTGFVKASGTTISYDNSTYLTANQTISFAPTGDVTGSTTGTTTIAPALVIGTNKVLNTMLAQMPTHTIKGNNTGGTANASDLTVAQVNAILPVFTSTLNGLAPLSGGGTTNFLRADGTWAALPAALGSWSITGNGGTSYATNFLGTTDNISLRFRTNNAERMIIDSTGDVGIGTSAFDPVQPEKLLVNAGSYPYNGAYKSTTPINAIGASNGYQQIQVQNRSYGNYASSDLVAASDGTTNGTQPVNTETNYVDLGINSSGYTNSNSNILNQPYTSYLYATSPQDFYIGNGYSGKDIIFFTNHGPTNTNNTADGFEIMRLMGGTAQQVTIGTPTANGTNKLTVSGSISASAFNVSSDRRLKTNITSLHYGLKEILALEPVSYNWKRTPTVDKQIGLIAQDAKKTIPEIVSGNEKTGTLSINYTELVPVLINAIKEQQQQIDSLKKDIQLLKEKK